MYRTNTFPGLNWTPGPAATQSYLVVMEDVGTARPEPVLHWTLFNIPPTLTRLEPGMTPTGNPPGSSYGPNISGQARPYLGPRTPPGPKHPYHFQVFALDRTLPADSINTFTTLLELAKGHVLASGELVGLGSADAK